MTSARTAARMGGGARGDAYFELVPESDGIVVNPLSLEGEDIGPLGLDDPVLDVVPPIRSDVDGEADGVPVPRSLVRPAGPWLQPVARAAMSESAKTLPSNCFMSTPLLKSDGRRRSKGGAAEAGRARP